MIETIARPTYEKMSVSLRSDQVVEIRRIAAEDRHGRFSRVVQEAVDRLLNDRNEGSDQREAIAS